MLDRNCIQHLDWLSSAPKDTKYLLKQIKNSEAPTDRIVTLVLHKLSASQSSTLGKIIQSECASNRTISNLENISLGIVSNSTTEISASCFAAAAARHGVQLKITLSPFDQMMQQALNEASEINTEKPDMVLIAVDYHWLEGHNEPDLAIDQMQILVDNFRSRSNATSILQTIPAPPITIFGNYDVQVADTIRSQIHTYNTKLIQLAKETNSSIFDVASIAERIGTDLWFDNVQWNAYKFAFSGEFNLIYSEMLGRILGASRGKVKKCLVLDLDNTLWGGVIGDDGVDGIRIGQGTAEGEAFLSIQRLALQLKERGIILAVCSKNDEAVARSGFRDNSHMLLQESDIAVFQANWIDKASNLEAIAKTLNIGIESLVLLDDNPAERAQVRAALPCVGVPELPNDPALYPLYLTSAGYFESISFSNDDKIRAASYIANAQRAKVKAQSRDIGDYLTSLEMELEGRPFDKSNLERINQLVNKTNQFNLTTQRTTLVEISDFMRDANYYTLQVRLKDSAGDLGMIGVLITKKNQTHWHIEQWLMSCRVLGRKVEEAMLSIVLNNAKQEAIETITGTYIPTTKNSMVSDHYLKLGFELTNETTSGTKTFKFDVMDTHTPNLPMKIEYIQPTEVPLTDSKEVA